TQDEPSDRLGAAAGGKLRARHLRRAHSRRADGGREWTPRELSRDFRLGGGGDAAVLAGALLCRSARGAFGIGGASDDESVGQGPRSGLGDRQRLGGPAAGV